MIHTGEKRASQKYIKGVEKLRDKIYALKCLIFQLCSCSSDISVMSLYPLLSFMSQKQVFQVIWVALLLARVFSLQAYNLIKF
ncbi:hypothetical protein PDJAM_G00170630, partial [Pangasius djambal]|nr:hypothetical protein [Pangasius djambal]